MKPVTDMYLTAALLPYGVELSRVDKENPKRQIFYFNSKPMEVWKLVDGKILKVEVIDLDQVELLFRSKKLVFLPDYHNFIRDTKSMIHQG